MVWPGKREEGDRRGSQIIHNLAEQNMEVDFDS